MFKKISEKIKAYKNNPENKGKAAKKTLDLLGTCLIMSMALCAAIAHGTPALAMPMLYVMGACFVSGAFCMVKASRMKTGTGKKKEEKPEEARVAAPAVAPESMPAVGLKNEAAAPAFQAAAEKTAEKPAEDVAVAVVEKEKPVKKPPGAKQG